MDDFLKFFGCIILGIIGFTTIAVYFANWANETQCRKTAELMDVPYHYDMSTPCMVQWHGEWLPLRSIHRMN